MLAMVRARRLQRRHCGLERELGRTLTKLPDWHAATRAWHRLGRLREVRMKAVRLLEYGGQLVFNDVPTPTIAGRESW